MMHLTTKNANVKKVLTGALLSTVFFLGFLSFTQAQEAQQGVDVTISPVFLDLRVEPGVSISDKIKIRNNTRGDLSLTATVKKLVSKDEKIDVLEPSALDEYISWVKFENPEIVIKPGEWGNINFTLDVPSDAAFGYYYMVTFKKTQSPDVQDGQTALSGEVGVPLLVAVVKDGAVSSAQLLDFKPKNNINEYLPVEFVATLRNTGNVHIRPRGNIFIKKESGGKDIGIIEVNSENGRILPDSQRSFETGWKDGFFVREPVTENGEVRLDKNGNPVTKLTFNLNKLTSFRFGKYSAEMKLVFDGGNKDVLIEGVTTFWVIPYTLIAIILGVLIIGFVLFKFVLGAYIKKQINNSKVQ